MSAVVPGYRTAKTSRPVRIHSASPPGGGYAPFSPAHLRQAVENFHKYQKSGNPAFPTPKACYVPLADVSVGHDEDQAMAKALLDRTDLPSCGYFKNVWMHGTDVFAELDGIPEPIARMCNSGQFSEVSAEIYPNYKLPDGRYIGPVFRRLALLGSTPARQKGLGTLPPLVYSFAEPARGGRPAQQVAVMFSEGPFMDRTAALAVLQAAGIDTTAFASMGPEADPLIIAFATYVQSQTGGGAGNPDQTTAAVQFSERVMGIVLPKLTAALRPFQDIAAKAVEQECVTFCETNRSKLYPFERDASQPEYVPAILAKMPEDMRRAEMARIAKRPNLPVQFGERIQDGTAGHVTGGDTGTISASRRDALLAATPAGRALLDRRKASGK